MATVEGEFPRSSMWANHGRYLSSRVFARLIHEYTLASSVYGVSKHGEKLVVNSTQPCPVGEDSFVKSGSERFSVLGVADGVGGWRDEGVDPSIFTVALMEYCAHISASSLWRGPVDILEEAYRLILKDSQVIAGSCTVCLSAFSHENGCLQVANLGDAGFALFREGVVHTQSTPQQHHFNAPYQLGKAGNDSHGQNPSSSDTYMVQLQKGDTLLLATDGLWDNVHIEDILSLIPPPMSLSENNLSTTVQDLVEHAVYLSKRREYHSPFAVSARQSGYHYNGGKVDDITAVMATVVK